MPRIGCLNGCPLDHHEPPCPRALPAPWDERDGQAYDRGYRDAARHFYPLGLEHGRAAAEIDQPDDQIRAARIARDTA